MGTCTLDAHYCPHHDPQAVCYTGVIPTEIVSCMHPSCMTRWPISLLACRWGKVLESRVRLMSRRSGKNKQLHAPSFSGPIAALFQNLVSDNVLLTSLPRYVHQWRFPLSCMQVLFGELSFWSTFHHHGDGWRLAYLVSFAEQASYYI